MKKILLLIILSLSSLYLSASTCQAIKNGNWSDNSVWSCGHVPTCSDLIIIPLATNVIVNNQVDLTSCPTPVEIQVYGTLTFQTGNKLRLPCGSVVYIAASGTMDPGNGGGNSNLLDICNVVLWTAANGTVKGPKTFGSPLPVELLSFDVKCNGKADVRWSTATETNNDYFTLERSSDAENWDFVANIPGAGNSNQLLNYQYTDEKSVSGISYYRIRQTDFDGKSETFSPVSVICSSLESTDITMYPNPFNSALVIHYSNLNEGKAQVQVFDMMGKLMASINMEVTTGSNDFILDLNNLANGPYFIEFTSSGNTYHQKILKN
ncbi:MAG: T9SS type A sorting domain-containing protein [Bacteroidota bacterium]